MSEDFLHSLFKIIKSYFTTSFNFREGHLTYLSLFKKRVFVFRLYILIYLFSFSSFRISSNKTLFSPSRLVSLLLLHFTYAYLCFYFHPKIVSNRSVDHDPSEVPHMLFDIKNCVKPHGTLKSWHKYCHYYNKSFPK